MFRQVIGMLIAGTVIALLSPATLRAGGDKEPRYVGAKQCKNCHRAKVSGDQYGKWESSKHAKAFATLSSDKAKEASTKQGVADAVKDAKCARCHVTAFEAKVELKDKNWTADDSVSCEACHGPAEKHVKARLAEQEPDPKAYEVRGSLAAEIALPTEKKCLECHNDQSPFYKPFDYKEFLKQIDHSNPKRKPAAAPKG